VLALCALAGAPLAASSPAAAAAPLAAPAAAAAAAPRAHAAVSIGDLAAQEDLQYAAGMVRVATEQMRERRACRLRYDAAPSFVDGPPSEQLRSRLALLRRPAIAEDAVPLDTPLLRYIEGKGVYGGWIRMGRAADGTELYLVAAQDRRRVEPASAACLRWRHRRLLRLLAPESRRIRTLALRAEARERRAERPRRAVEPRERVFLYERTNGNNLGLGGISADLGELERRGLLTTAAFATDPRQLYDPDRARVLGVLPDGVATAEVTYPRRADRGRFAPAQVYESALRLTVPVQDNVISYQVARQPEDALPPKMVWRAADGSVVRVVRRR